MAQEDLKTDVAVLKTEMENIQSMFTKLDTAIDKIATASGDISRILAVHDGQIGELVKDVEERRRLSEKETELLHRRVSEMKDDVIAAIKEMDKKATQELSEMNERITLLERWKWWIMGGSWAIGFAIATLTSTQVLAIVEALSK